MAAPLPCAVCQSTSTSSRCSRCKNIVSCYVECAKLAWPVHKGTCFAGSAADACYLPSLSNSEYNALVRVPRIGFEIPNGLFKRSGLWQGNGTNLMKALHDKTCDIPEPQRSNLLLRSLVAVLWRLAERSAQRKPFEYAIRESRHLSRGDLAHVRHGRRREPNHGRPLSSAKHFLSFSSCSRLSISTEQVGNSASEAY